MKDLTPEEEKHCLKAIGIQSIGDLFSTIPPQIRENSELKLDSVIELFGQDRALTETELSQYFRGLSDKNLQGLKTISRHFLGGGCYDNVNPAALEAIVDKLEWRTAFSPDRAELSQGTLQMLFELQTYLVRITGMQVATAAPLDAATAVAEACAMAQRLRPESTPHFLIAGSLAPDTRAVLATYAKGQSASLQTIAWQSDGALDLEKLSTAVTDKKPTAVIVGYPNYFGIIEPLDEIKARLPGECQLIAAATDIAALSIFESPGKLHADFVVGSLQQLGSPLAFGRGAGFLATRHNYLAKFENAVVEEQENEFGAKQYRLILGSPYQTEGALRAAAFLSLLGENGFSRLGEINFSRFDFLVQELERTGIPLKFAKGLHFREGVFQVPNLKTRFANALSRELIPGIRMVEKFPGEEFEDCILVCVHPNVARPDLEALVEVLSHD